MKVKKLMAPLFLVLMLVVLSACGQNGNTNQVSTGASNQKEESTNAPDELTPVKVGFVCGGMTPILTQIGINDGTFEKNGLAIEKVCFTSGADAIQALVGGSIDINLGSYEHVLRQLKNGLDVKAYGEIFNGVGYALVVKQDSTYQSLTDLKGKVLAVTKVGSLSDTGLRSGLSGEGINPETEVSIINGGSGATMLAAIESDQAAGGMVSEPTTSQMISTGNFRVLYDPPFDYAGIVVMAKTEWVDANQNAMKKFLASNKEVYDKTIVDPESAIKPLQNEFEQISEEVLLQAINNQFAKILPDLKITKEAAEMVASTQLELGAIIEEIPFEETVDFTFLP